MTWTIKPPYSVSMAPLCVVKRNLSIGIECVLTWRMVRVLTNRACNEPSQRFHNHREGPILGSSPGWNTRAVSFNTLLRHYAKHGLLRYCKAFAKVRWMQALVVTMTPHPLIVGYCSITPPPAWGATMRPQWRRRYLFRPATTPLHSTATRDIQGII